MKPVRIALIGAGGRLGQAIMGAAKNDPDVVITAECKRGDAIPTAIQASDTVLDVSHPDAARQICEACIQERKALVIGTTGHSPEQRQNIAMAARAVPVLVAPNFSVGVNALYALTRKAAELLGVSFDLEIVEMHHRLKKDAPSGTAKQLAEILCDVRSLDVNEHVTYGRQGNTGARPTQEIGMHAIRGGDIAGDHTVIFAGAGERLELTHRASSRDAFALGALRAVRWIVGKPPGVYSMQDVLGV